jgi:hypothetical protein
MILAGCATQRQPLAYDKALMREVPALRIEEKIRDMVRDRHEWEMAQ